MKNLIFFCFCILLHHSVWSQCPVANFSIPSSTCLDSNLPITNNSASNLSVDWDFCDGSILNLPTLLASTTIGSSSGFDIKSIEENGKVYAFVTSNGNSKILRYEYNATLSNTPTVVDFGNFGVISSPTGIDFWNDGSTLYGLVSTSGGAVYRLSFGTSITNTPTVTSVGGVSGLTDLRHVRITKDNNKIYGLIAGGSMNNLVMLDFGTSLANTPTQRLISVPSGSYLGGIDVEKQCDETFVHLTGYFSGLHVLNFGNNLQNSPSFVNITSVSNPLGISLEKSRGSYHALISSNVDGIVRLNFGTSMTNASPVKTILGKFGSIDFAFGFTLLKSKTKYYGLAVNYTDNKLTLLDFPKDCSLTSNYAGEYTPTIAYSTPGTFYATLRTRDAQGNENTLTNAITVSSLTAPDVDFSFTNSCLDYTFTALNSSGSITNYNWNFGDATTGSGSSPSHQYAMGGMNNSVVLSITNSSGCTNQVSKSISVYNPPQANFTLPVGGISCTNQNYTFVNTSTADVGATPTWEWRIDGNLVSTTEDLVHSFSSLALHEVRLKAMLPGCSHEFAQNVTPAAAGPLVDFTFVPACQNSTVTFTNSTVGAADSFVWTLGDTSPLVNTTNVSETVSHVYSLPANYNVTLQAINSGCQNTLTKSLPIYTIPTPNFAHTLAPFSCVGTPSQFTDLTPAPTDSNISQWNWTFDLNGNTSTQQHPAHIYGVSGTYAVTLAVTTDRNCSNSIQKNISVSLTPAPAANFTSQSTVCQGENLFIQNMSLNATNFKWDFCDGSILNTPTSTSGVLAGASSAFDVKAYREGTKNFVFVVNNGDSKLLRLEYNAAMSNTPTILNLGTLGISSPRGIALWRENNNYFGLISTSGGSVYLLAFGSTMSNAPIATAVSGLSGLTDLRHVKIVGDNNRVFALIAGGAANNIVVLDFGSTITNTPTQRLINVPSGSYPTGIDIVKECGHIYALVSAYFSGVHLLDFGGTLQNTPTFTNLATVTNPLGLTIENSQGNYHVFISSNTEGIVRLDYGTTMATATPTKTVLGKFGSIDFALGFTLFNSASTYFGLAINNTDNKLTVLNFPKSCAITGDYEGQQTPVVSYANAGTFSATLRAYDANGMEDTFTKQIVVSGLVAPDIDFSSSINCQDFSFTPVNTSGGLTAYSWNFGDGSAVSSTSSPTHSYAVGGNYNVVLQATRSNGCINNVHKTVTVFNTPQVDFLMPTNSPLCTNQLLNFTNTTIFDVASNPSWEWLVDGVSSAATKDYQRTFTTSSAPVIKLRVTTPGCVRETSKTLTSLLAGPVINFDLPPVKCEQTALTFVNTTSSVVTGYLWSFGDGQTSMATNPTNTYSSKGTFNVSLQGSSSNGCNNTLTKNITVYSKPQTDFYLLLPPFSCSGFPSQFKDLTPNPSDSFISSWLWDFNDPASGSNAAAVKDPQHTYNVAGRYNVTLTTTTNFGCSASVLKQVVVEQSPVAGFTNTPACKDVPVTFSDNSGIPIKSWDWQIGLNSYLVANPTHLFTLPGDYIVDLTVVGENDCIGYSSKSVNVPNTLTPEFVVEKNCNLQNTIFTDMTKVSSDAVVARNWEFSSLGMGSGSPATFSFSTPGNYDVKLNTVTASGCVYSLSKKITIVNGPVASFTASPEEGIPPLVVDFTNTSTNASTYLWTFNDKDNTTSALSSPSYTFEGFGDHVVDLTVTNAQGCTATFSKIIKTVLPVNDIAVVAITAVKSENGFIKVLAALKNNGNTEVSGSFINLDLSGFTTIREKVAVALSPKAVLNHVFTYELADVSQLNYLCAEVELANDINSQNNRKCISLNEEVVVTEPYPNPANEEIAFDLIGNDQILVTVTLVDGMGKEVFRGGIQSVSGDNHFRIPVGAVQSGIYHLIVQAGEIQRACRVAITH